MHNVFRRKAGLIVPAIAALVALSATQAWADEAPPVPAKLIKHQKPQAHQGHQAGMKHGGRQMHDEMMHDHQMGVNASGGMQMGCGGKAGCKDNMPMAPKAQSDQAPPAANMSAAPMSDDM